jgi:predicted transcriptional regulator
LAKAKLSVTVQEHLAEGIQELATARSHSLSKIVEAALVEFLETQLAAEMAEGYQSMAEFDRALAEGDMTAGFEVLPDA